MQTESLWKRKEVSLFYYYYYYFLIIIIIVVIVNVIGIVIVIIIVIVLVIIVIAIIIVIIVKMFHPFGFYSGYNFRALVCSVLSSIKQARSKCIVNEVFMMYVGDIIIRYVLGGGKTDVGQKLQQ